MVERLGFGSAYPIAQPRAFPQSVAIALEIAHYLKTVAFALARTITFTVAHTDTFPVTYTDTLPFAIPHDVESVAFTFSKSVTRPIEIPLTSTFADTFSKSIARPIAIPFTHTIAGSIKIAIEITVRGTKRDSIGRAEFDPEHGTQHGTAKQIAQPEPFANTHDAIPIEIAQPEPFTRAFRVAVQNTLDCTHAPTYDQPDKESNGPDQFAFS